MGVGAHIGISMISGKYFAPGDPSARLPINAATTKTRTVSTSINSYDKNKLANSYIYLFVSI